jgi:NADP-dependent 3-hydroxy acid dehydrogenase YdfG
MAYSMDRWKGRVALVTGASAGIGYAIANELARCGMKVIGCSRNIAKIEELSKDLKEKGVEGCVVPIKCDVRSEEEIKSLFSKAKEDLGGVDVCINNAGLAFATSPLLSQTTEEWKEMSEVNIVGLMTVTREFVKQMQERKCDNGHIININSVSGHRTTTRPEYAFYTATKYAVTALTEGIRVELRQKKSKIRVTGISPGFVRTEFRGRAQGVEDIEESKKEYDKLVEEVLEAEDITSLIVFALSAHPRVDVNDIIVRPATQEL